MWKSLELLTYTLSKAAIDQKQDCREIILADIGCGTGLATELLLRGPLSEKIKTVHLVDTSTEMLNRCKRRAQSWKKETHFYHGRIDLLADESVDILLMSSVLHHIPDIREFCEQISRVIRPGGVFIHMQDPRSGGINDSVLRERAERFSAIGRNGFLSWKTWPRILRLPMSALIRLNIWRKHSHIREVNKRLINAGAISIPMSAGEIWSVTDVHVEGLPFAIGKGVSMEALSAALSAFENTTWKTYGFFGALSSDLPKQLKREEEDLFNSGDKHGAQVAGVWVKGR
jgi:SAM-dependent methyltransferase